MRGDSMTKADEAFRIVEEEVNREPERYWIRHLKRHNRAELTAIETHYPKYRVVTIDVSKVLNKGIWEEILAGREVDHIKDASREIMTPKDHHYQKLKIRFVHIAQKRSIRDLRNNDARKLISIKCLVRRMTQVDSKVLKAQFVCANGHDQKVTPVNDMILKPTSCVMQGCTSRTFRPQSAHHERVDRQFLYVQEQIEDLEGAIQPASLRCEVVEELCNVVNVGDRVELNGYMRLLPKTRGGEVTNSEILSFEVNSVEMEKRGYDSVTISDEDEAAIKALAAQPDIFRGLAQSIAPSILGMSLVKSVVVLLLFGGVNKTLEGGSTSRGEINALLVTDPGLAKTQILRFAARIAPRGIFANATTSSKVGLVAAVVKDETTGQHALEAGAYMLASGGVLCLDELSALSKDDTKMLNECMENGEAHISKAGINTMVRAQAAMLAACNPEKGRFDGYKSLKDQLSIDPSVLSRFDVVVLLQDLASNEQDTEIAQFILKSHKNAKNGTPLSKSIDPDMIRKYISYSRRIDPVLTDEAMDVLEKFYVKTRPASDTGDTIAITTRQVPALIRLAEASARTRLSKEVTKEDAELAVEVLKKSLLRLALDPDTGKIDEDRIAGKTCAQSRGFNEVLISVVRELTEENGAAKIEMIISKMSLKNYPTDRIEKTLNQLAREGVLIQTKNGVFKVM